jgi:hypothetical protein
MSQEQVQLLVKKTGKALEVWVSAVGSPATLLDASAMLQSCLEELRPFVAMVPEAQEAFASITAIVEMAWLTSGFEAEAAVCAQLLDSADAGKRELGLIAVSKLNERLDRLSALLPALPFRQRVACRVAVFTTQRVLHKFLREWRG